MTAFILATAGALPSCAIDQMPPRQAPPPVEPPVVVVSTPSATASAQPAACAPCAPTDAVSSADAGALTPAVSAEAPPAAAEKRTLQGVVTATPAFKAANVVVYLDDGPKEPTRGMAAMLDQKNMLFIPDTVAVTVGGTITFLNSDPFPHNVFSMDHEKFNFGTIGLHGSVKHTFNEVGGYTLLCNLHPGMIGHVFVAPSSYFAVTDWKGNFAIKGVPEGTYKVAVWSSKMSADTQSLTVKGGDATANFTLHR